MSDFDACDCTIWSFCCGELPKAAAEIARLRAALEEICDYDKAGGEYVITCKRIAKQALNPD